MKFIFCILLLVSFIGVLNCKKLRRKQVTFERLCRVYCKNQNGGIVCGNNILTCCDNHGCMGSIVQICKNKSNKVFFMDSYDDKKVSC